MSEDRDTSVFEALFRHNGWCNTILLDFCEGLTDEQLDATLVGTFGNIRQTLVHYITAEVSYVNRANGHLPALPPPKDSFINFALLKDAVRWTEEELLQLAISARAGMLVRQTPPRANTEYPLAGLMAQTLSHSIEHRTQVCSIISALGLEPPDLSGWAFMDSRHEIKDL